MLIIFYVLKTISLLEMHAGEKFLITITQLTYTYIYVDTRNDGLAPRVRASSANCQAGAERETRDKLMRAKINVLMDARLDLL
jgi:hypothetical protein